MTKSEKNKLMFEFTETMKLISKSSMENVIWDLLKRTEPQKVQCSFLYLNTTEDFATYYKKYNNPSSFLTVGASGDHILNAITIGAKEIDAFDINPLCRHAISLRLAALKGLSKEEFVEYFQTFDPTFFEKLFDYLPESSQIYWGVIYTRFAPNVILSADLIREKLFIQGNLEQSLITDINLYLQDDNYEKTKRLANDTTINFIESDIYDLLRVLKGKRYDGMTFSNIYEYLNYHNVSFQKAQEYRQFIIDLMAKNLNSGGTIMASYLYAWSKSLKEDFDRMHKNSPTSIAPNGAITLSQYEEYLKGHTEQNLAYSYLLDAFANDDVEYLKTKHVRYGQSKDMSHDLALLLKK